MRERCGRCGGQLYRERQLGNTFDVVCLCCGARRYADQGKPIHARPLVPGGDPRRRRKSQ